MIEGSSHGVDMRTGPVNTTTGGATRQWRVVFAHPGRKSVGNFVERDGFNGHVADRAPGENRVGEGKRPAIGHPADLIGYGVMANQDNCVGVGFR